MAEDGAPNGFVQFGTGNSFIANDAAVRNALSHLVNNVSYEASFEHLERAVEAVQEATRMQDVRSVDLPDDPGIANFGEGADFFL